MHVQTSRQKSAETIFDLDDHPSCSIVMSFSRKGAIAANVRVFEPFVRIELSARTGRQSEGVSLVERMQSVGVLFALGSTLE